MPFRATWIMVGAESATGWLALAAAGLALAAVMVARRGDGDTFVAACGGGGVVCAAGSNPAAGATLHTWNRWVPAEVQQTYGTEYSRLVIEPRLDPVRVAAMLLALAAVAALALAARRTVDGGRRSSRRTHDEAFRQALTRGGPCRHARRRVGMSAHRRGPDRHPDRGLAGTRHLRGHQDAPRSRRDGRRVPNQHHRRRKTSRTRSSRRSMRPRRWRSPPEISRPPSRSSMPSSRSRRATATPRRSRMRSRAARRSRPTPPDRLRQPRQRHRRRPSPLWTTRRP